MPRFEDRAREELLDEYVRLKAQNISDAQIARRFGVSQMTILRWKQRYGLASRTAPTSEMPADVDRQGTAEEERPQTLRQAAPSPQLRDGQAPSTELETLARENAWLRELAGRLLLENERLRAQLAGRLPQAVDAE